ncbi:MAG TPA: tetratricopeptide repeat protein [Verrucomicrobiota bacterium]|nr:tetratricopeptide repeat protein [Verrucomicrobiota bacterium]HQL80173.1 tetratricopeptide repeat protein [Verrucomicrobiota bacterium]
MQDSLPRSTTGQPPAAGLVAAALWRADSPAGIALRAGLILVLTLLAYWPALTGEFLWDDDVLLTRNAFVQNLVGIKHIWLSGAQVDYLPLTLTSFWLEWRLWGPHPTGYHVTNVLLHALAAVLLWRLLVRLKVPGAWLAAVIFAVHPLCVASVAWIAERKNTLSIVFFFLSLLWYLRSEAGALNPHSALRTPHSSVPQRRFYWFSLLAFILAMLSKQAVAAGPFVLLLLAWWRNGRIDRRDLVRAAPFFAVALVMGLVAIGFHSKLLVNPDELERPLSWPARMLGGSWAVWFYLYKSLLPMRLSAMYPRWEIDPGAPLAYLPGLMLVLVGWVLWRYRKGWGRHAILGLGYFVVVLSPTLGFFKMAYWCYALVADHWVYFAVPGVAAAVGAGLACLAGANPAAIGARRLRLWFAAAVAVALVGLLALASNRRARIYADSTALWQETVRQNPSAWIAWYNWGTALAKHNMITEAEGKFAETVRQKPDYALGHCSLGGMLLVQGKTEAALRELLAALKLDPSLPDAQRNLAALYAATGKTDEALFHFQESLRLDPFHPASHYCYGNLLVKLGRAEEAQQRFARALELQPGYAEAHLALGHLLAASGKKDEAARHFRAASTGDLTPESHYSLGYIFASQGKMSQAEASFRAALQARPEFSVARFALGRALVEQGKLAEARECFQALAENDPLRAEACECLGIGLAKSGNAEAAIREFTNALKLDPKRAGTHRSMGNALVMAGRIAEAITSYREALRLQPDLQEALNNLAWVLATGKEAKLRDGADAVRLAEHAARLTGGNYGDALDTLSAAYAEARRFPDAIAAAQRALAATNPPPDTARVKQIQTRLQLYQAGKAWRE